MKRLKENLIGTLSILHDKLTELGTAAAWAMRQ